MARVELIPRDGRGDTPQTPGMVREEAFTGDGFWSGVVYTEPGMVSAWHHHGEHETYAFVTRGRARFEFGPGGREAVDAGPGDFVQIPSRIIHRELNPGEETSEIVLFRQGRGTVVTNVEGPQSD